jgi:hypothetical protein
MHRNTALLELWSTFSKNDGNGKGASGQPRHPFENEHGLLRFNSPGRSIHIVVAAMAAAARLFLVILGCIGNQRV